MEIQEYLEYCKNNFDVQQYNEIKKALTLFDNFLKKNLIFFNRITKEDFNNFYNQLIKQYKHTTTVYYINYVKDYYRHLIKQNILKKSFLNKLSFNKIKGHAKYYYITKKDLEKIITTVIGFYDIDELKIRAIIYTLFYTGFTQKELLDLERRDIICKKGYIISFHDYRIIYIPKELIKILEDYYLIEEERINAFNLTPHIILILRECFQYYNPNLTFGTFRASYIIHLINKKVDIRAIKYLLGFSSFDKIAEYYKFVPLSMEKIERISKRIVIKRRKLK